MANPSSFPRALDMAYTVTTVVLVAICACGYWYWGLNAHVLVTQDFEVCFCILDLDP